MRRTFRSRIPTRSPKRKVLKKVVPKQIIKQRISVPVNRNESNFSAQTHLNAYLTQQDNRSDGDASKTSKQLAGKPS